MLFLCAFLLLLVGFVNLFSTSGGEFSGWNSFTRQVVFTSFGLMLLLGSLFFDYKILKFVYWPIYFLSIGLVILVHFYGINVNGATRWLPLFSDSIRFQPSEFMKIATVVALSAYLSSKETKGGLGLVDLIFPTLLVGLPCYIILKQPDMGTALHIALTVIPIFIIRKIKMGVLVTLVAIVVISTSWVFFFGGLNYLLKHDIIKSYHLDRYESFVKSDKDPNGKGWQINQSKSAIGSGQLNGRGYMSGSQQKYGFLPAAETDFAFAALAEEWGFMGSVVTLVLFFGLIWAALSEVSRSGDMFGALMSVGMASLIFFQMLVNIGMVTGLLPVIGIPLPFISYGGTSSIMNIMCIAIVLNVGMRRFKFSEAPIQQNPEIWEKPPSTQLVEEPSMAVRRLLPHDPKEPDQHPAHRLPHMKPWLKHLAPKGWLQQQQIIEPQVTPK
jgi:rod shape determining protein RodA